MTIEPERTRTSYEVYVGKLITLRKLNVDLPGGRSTMREVVVHPDVVAILALLDDGRVVMVRQYRKAVERVLLEVPAGGIDVGESPEEAVRREFKEETGYEARSLRRLTGFYTSPGFVTEYMHLYLATDLEAGEPTEQNDQLEVIEMTLSEVEQAVAAGDVQDAKTLIALDFYRTLLPAGDPASTPP